MSLGNKGNPKGNPKLTAEQVAEIRRRKATQTAPQIVKEMGLPITANWLYRIIWRKAWL